MIVGACRPHNAFEQKARQQTRARLHQSPSSQQTASQYVRQLAAGGILPTGGVIPEHVMLQAIRELQDEVNDANQTMQQLRKTILTLSEALREAEASNEDLLKQQEKIHWRFQALTFIDYYQPLFTEESNHMNAADDEAVNGSKKSTKPLKNKDKKAKAAKKKEKEERRLRKKQIVQQFKAAKSNRKMMEDIDPAIFASLSDDEDSLESSGTSDTRLLSSDSATQNSTYVTVDRSPSRLPSSPEDMVAYLANRDATNPSGDGEAGGLGMAFAQQLPDGDDVQAAALLESQLARLRGDDSSFSDDDYDDESLDSTDSLHLEDGKEDVISSHSAQSKTEEEEEDGYVADSGGPNSPTPQDQSGALMFDASRLEDARSFFQTTERGAFQENLSLPSSQQASVLIVDSAATVGSAPGTASLSAAGPRQAAFVKVLLQRDQAEVRAQDFLNQLNEAQRRIAELEKKPPSPKKSGKKQKSASLKESSKSKANTSRGSKGKKDVEQKPKVKKTKSSRKMSAKYASKEKDSVENKKHVGSVSSKTKIKSTDADAAAGPLRDFEETIGTM